MAGQCEKCYGVGYYNTWRLSQPRDYFVYASWDEKRRCDCEMGYMLMRMKSPSQIPLITLSKARKISDMQLNSEPEWDPLEEDRKESTIQSSIEDLPNGLPEDQDLPWEDETDPTKDFLFVSSCLSAMAGFMVRKALQQKGYRWLSIPVGVGTFLAGTGLSYLSTLPIYPPNK